MCATPQISKDYGYSNRILFVSPEEDMHTIMVHMPSLTTLSPLHQLENLILCVKREKTEYGQFMGFEPLTLVPFDRDLINMELMDVM